MASVVVEVTVVRTRRGLSCAAREEEKTARMVVEGGDKGDRRPRSEPLGLSHRDVGNARDGVRVNGSSARRRHSSSPSLLYFVATSDDI